MKTIIEMAREAKLLPNYEVYKDDLKRFAELVRAEAKAEEREACVQIVENEAAQYAEPVWAFEIVNDIRARVNT